MRTWFEGRNRREQVLVTVFVLLIAAVWLLGAMGRLRTQLAGWRSTQTGLATQQLWLDRQQDIEARSAAAVRNLDPARTYDATRLVGTVNSLASAAGMNLTIDPPQTLRTPQFAYHTAKVTFRRTDLPALLKFYDELGKQAPYLNLESIALQSEHAAAGTLNVTLQISATQITKLGN
jgi:hypothetical protein